MSNPTAPLLDPKSLDRDDSRVLTDLNIYDYTVASWLDAVKRLGPVFRTELAGSDCVVIATDQANKQAWKTPDDWSYRDTDTGTFFCRQMGEDHVSALDAEPHRRLRKLLLPAFGAAALGRDLTIAAATMQQAFQASVDVKANLYETLSQLCIRSLAQTQVKVSLHDDLLKKLNRYEEEFINGQQLTLPHQDSWFARVKHQKLRATAFEFFNKTALERKSGPRVDDSLDLLLQRKPAPGTAPLTDSELTEAVYLLTVAGVGNIARILCPLLWCISDTPWLNQLREEVRGFDPTLLTGMKNFPVMRAIISETERCFAPAPIVPKRTTKDINFLGISIPSGTLIMHLHALSHFDEKRYPDPLKFNPARWLTADLEKPNAFGGGKHMCLGMGVTRVYIPLILATLFSRHGLEIEHAPMLESLEPSFQPAPISTVMNATVTQ